jgi:hypothetical protein
MAESTALLECNPSMDATSETTQVNAHRAEDYISDSNQTLRPTSPMDEIKQEDMSMGMSMAMSASLPLSSASMVPKQRPATLKGSKSSNMLRSVTTPHPLSMTSSHSSLHHFQTTGTMYTTTPASGFTSNGTPNGSNGSIFPNNSIGPLSAPSSPSFPTSTLPSSTTTPSFLAMHGHNTSLYEPFRRNSVPILTAEQAEHKRKVSEEKLMQRQGSWSSLSSTPSAMMGGGVLGVHPPVLHHLDGGHLDHAALHYYRTQFSQQQLLQQQHQQQLHLQQHALNQVMPPSNSSNCSSPMPDTFMAGSAMNNGPTSSSSAHHSTTGAIRGSSKVKRNNSICSTTSVSSTGSGSNNKHPCKFPSCEWSFKRYEHLKRHMLVHTKERPFQCEFPGCNKSFSRSDNFSAHLRTHSKKALAHRRYDNRGMETGNGSMAVKQESQDSSQTPSSSSPTNADQANGSGFVPHSSLHLSNASEYGREYSPPVSPDEAPSNGRSSALGTSSSMNDDESFDIMGHSSYPFGGNSMYQMEHLDHLNSMVPRIDNIRLDLKSVVPVDIHKQYGDDGNSSASEGIIPSSDPNGESPRSSPMPQYDHFPFPSSISTHFMPMMSPGFSADQSSQHPPQQTSHMSQEPLTSSGSYSSLSASDSFHQATSYHGSDADLKSLQFSHGADSDLQYSPSPPSNEDSSHLHHPQPYHHTSYEGKALANNGMLHHNGYSSMSTSATATSVGAALPPHPLMSTMPSSPVPGMNESQFKTQRPVSKFQLKQQRPAQTA